MLGRTSIRALSVFDVCSGQAQKRALEKSRARIREIETQVLRLLEEQVDADIQPLLREREALCQRLAWLQLDAGSIAQYHASGRHPTANSDIVFVTRMAAHYYGVPRVYEARPDMYDVLMAEAVLPQPPQVEVYPEPNYPDGKASVLAGAVPDWSRPVGSLRVAPGSAVTLFSERGFWGNWHVITADIPNFYSSSRLGLAQGAPVGSLSVYSLCNLPYTGGWIITLEPGLYLSARQSEILRLSKSAGPWEVFRLDVIDSLGPDRAKILLSVDDVTPAREFVPDAVHSGGVYILSEQRAQGYRRFTLTDLTGRPVIVDGDMLKVGFSLQQPVLLTRAIKVAKNESEVGMLQLGEAALYEHANYWGRVWVVHESTPEFPAVAGLNEAISSIRLGPYTGVTLYGHTGFRVTVPPDLSSLQLPFGPWPFVPEATRNAIAKSMEAAQPRLVQDITEDKPNLAESPSGAEATVNLDEAASSIRLWTVIPPEEADIEYTCRLSQDYRLKPDGRTEEIFAYRTTLKFAQHIDQVTISATDATTIEIAGVAYKVAEDCAETVPVPINKQLVIISEARDLHTPALKIHTNGMPDGAQAVIFPDREVHQRLANLKEGELWEAEVREGGPSQPSLDEPVKKPLIDRSKFTKEQIGNAQKAIQTAMSSIAYEEPGLDEVWSAARFVSARAARDQAWMLDMGLYPSPAVRAVTESTPRTRAGQPSEKRPPRPLNPVVDYTALDVQQLGAVLGDTLAGSLQQGLFSWVEDVGDFVWNKIIVAPVNYIWDHAQDFGEDVIDGLKEFGTAAWREVKDFGDKLVAFVINAAGDVAAFVLDTAEKVIAVVKTIVEKIAAFVEDAVEAIKKFIEFLAFLFDWGDILDTQKALMSMFNDLMDEGQTWIRQNKVIVTDRLERAAQDFKEQLFPSQSSLKQDLQGDGFRLPSAVQETVEVISEVQEKIDWAMDKVFNIIPSPQIELLSIDASDRATLNKIVFAGSDELASLMSSVAGGVVDVFEDGLSPQKLLAGILGLLETLVDAAIDVAVDFVESLFEIVELLLSVLSKGLNHAFYVPILSEIYELLTDQKLSILSLTTLVLAIPVTVATKIATGKKPFADDQPSITLPAIGHTPRERQISVQALPPSAGGPAAEASEAVPAPSGDEDKNDGRLTALKYTSAFADTYAFGLSAVLDATAGKEPNKSGAIAIELGEITSLIASWISFAASTHTVPFVDLGGEHKGEDPDVWRAEIAKWVIEAIGLLTDTGSAIYSKAKHKVARRARRSPEEVLWATSWLLGVAHLTSVSVICAKSDDMKPVEKAAEVLMSLPGPLGVLRHKTLAKNKYALAALVFADVGGAAGSIMSAFV